jgi:hypothetical protein
MKAIQNLSLVWCVVVSSVAGAAERPALRGVGVEETLDAPPALQEALAAAKPPVGDVLPTAIRLALPPGAGAAERAALEGRLAAPLPRKTSLIVTAGTLPGIEGADAWKEAVRALVEKGRGRVTAYEFAAARPRPAARDAAFVLKMTVVQVRASDADALVVLGGLGADDANWLESLYAEDVGAYLDGVAIAAGEAAEPAALSALLGELPAVTERHDSSAALLVTGIPLGGDPAAATRRLVDWELRLVGTRVSLATFAGPVESLAPALSAAGTFADVLTGEVVPLDPKSAALTMKLEGRDVTETHPYRLLYDVSKFATYFIYWGGGAATTDTLQIELGEAAGKPPMIRDPVTRKQGLARDFLRDERSKRSRVNVVPVADRPLLLVFSSPDSAYVSRAEVTEGVLPPVSEVIARHQQVQAAQDARLQTYVADARMDQHFRPSATDPGFDVVTENRFYFERSGTEWEELSFTLNGSKWGADRPPFPLLQPEKVLSLPLDLQLSKDYTYKLEGVDEVEGRQAYAVRFEPLDAARSLYRGTVWIDAETYVKLKVQTVQTQLPPPVVSSEEVQSFSPVEVADGAPLWLFTRLVGKQIMLVAGRNLLVEREVRFSNFKVNDPAFADLRAASRGSKNVMYKDTEKGLRYYVKKGEERIVQENPTTTAKALAVGVTIDPSYDYPLPLLGVNYLDFEFLGKNNQLALLFGGILALVNVQHPKLIGDKIDGSVDLFAIAVPVNDQVYGVDGEIEDQRFRNHPFSTGLNLGWQFTEFQKLTAGYQFRFDAYSADDLTDPRLAEPADTITNGVGLSYEYKRKGYALGASAFTHRRATWREWGAPGDFRPDHQSYEKFSASLTKDFFFGLHKIHLNAAYYGGRNLDRFSSYQFGFFDENRIHGVPSAGVRFPELAMLRGGYSFNLFDLYRVDVFLEQAWGKDAEHVGATDRSWRPVTGIGLGLNLRGPFGTLLRTDLGKSFLPGRYSGSGSFVGQIMVLKPI